MSKIKSLSESRLHDVTHGLPAGPGPLSEGFPQRGRDLNMEVVRHGCTLGHPERCGRMPP